MKLFSFENFQFLKPSCPDPLYPLFGVAQAEQSSAEGGPDAEDPPGVRGSPGRGDPNTAHYARVEGESTKGAPSQKSGDRYTDDPPGVRGSPGRGDQNTARPGSSTDPVPDSASPAMAPATAPDGASPATASAIDALGSAQVDGMACDSDDTTAVIEVNTKDGLSNDLVAVNVNVRDFQIIFK